MKWNGTQGQLNERENKMDGMDGYMNRQITTYILPYFSHRQPSMYL